MEAISRIKLPIVLPTDQNSSSKAKESPPKLIRQELFIQPGTTSVHQRSVTHLPTTQEGDEDIGTYDILDSLL